MIFKLESFIKQIRWKAYIFEKPNEIDDATAANNFGFKSVLKPPKNEHLNDLVGNIEFKRANRVFQNQLNKDIKMINKDPLLFIPADKSNNLYKVSKDTYSKLLQDNITKLYKKSNVTLINNINKQAKAITSELNLDNRIEQLNQLEAFVTLKNHKENFQNDLKCRLINPDKSKIS